MRGSRRRGRFREGGSPGNFPGGWVRGTTFAGAETLLGFATVGKQPQLVLHRKGKVYRP